MFSEKKISLSEFFGQFYELNGSNINMCHIWRANIEVIELNEMNFEKNNKSDGFEEIISSLFNFVNLCEPDINLEMNLKHPDLMGYGISFEIYNRRGFSNANL